MGAGLSRTLKGMAETKIGKETGSPGGFEPTKQGSATVYLAEPIEYNTELAFPNNIAVFDKMRADSQVQSVLNGIQLPIMSARWDLYTEGVDETVVQLIRTELGLPEPGQAMAGRQRRQGISWRKHLGDVLMMVWAGFMPFEQVYEVAPARPDQEGIGLSSIVHLRKLAPRLPRSIQEIRVEKDGGLKSIVQEGIGDGKPVVIPVENLVMYVHGMEGADWYGRSILRTAYKNWLIADTLTRLDAQAGERQSMGIPVVKYTDEGDPDTAEQISTNIRAGATSGISFKDGAYDVSIMGVQGNTVDLLPKINHHNQQIAKNSLAMFLDLGHDSGARSLGETHLRIFMRSLQRLADQIADTATEHIIRDLVELNFGEGTPYPVLTPGDLAANEGITAEALADLVNAGVLLADDVLESYIRKSHNLPGIDAATRREPSGGTTGDQLARGLAHQHKIVDLVEQITATRTLAARKSHDVPAV